MFKIIYKHLAYQFIIPFLTSIVFFVTFLLIFQIFRILSYIVQKNVEVVLIAKLIGHIALSFVPVAVPISTLFAIIYVLSRLSEDSEMIAMRSFGYSKYRLFAPFLVMGLCISAALFSLDQEIIPASQKAFKIGVVKLTSKSLLGNIKKNEFFVDIPQTTFYAETKEGKFYGHIFINRRGKKSEKVIVAQKGFFIRQKYDEWGGGLLRMKLFDGNIIEYSSDFNIRKIKFKQYEFPIMDGRVIEASTGKLSTISSKILYQRIQKYKGSKRNKTLVRLKIEYWERINNALLPILFMFLGFSLGIKQGRGRGTNATLVALLTVIAYYTIYFTGVSMAKKFVIPAELAVFLPIIMLSLVGGFFFRRLNWLS